MLVRLLPLIAGVVPIAGVSYAYWLGTQTGVLPGCIPYLEGCTSISSTGRHMPGALPFRASLFPQAAFLMFIWWFAALWVRALERARYAQVIVIAGATGAVALIVYVTFLGTTAPFYEFMRQVGIYFYFLGTVVAQTLVTLSLDSSRLRNAMLIVVAAPWAMGIANFVQKTLLVEPNNIENRVEWVVALLMQTWFVLLYLYWRRYDWDVKVTSATQ